MKNFRLERRDLLRWIACYGPPLVLLPGCGSRGTNTAKATTGSTNESAFASLQTNQQFMCDASAACKPLVEFFSYAPGTLDAAVTDLNAALYDVATAPDRFDDGSLCYQFNGKTSLATVANIANFPLGTLAVSFWAKSSNKARSQVLALSSDGTIFAAIEFNSGCGLGVFWTHFEGYQLEAGNAGDYTDGAWHHFLVQFDGSMLSAFVDGIAKGSTPAQSPQDAGVATSGAAVSLFVGGGTTLGWVGDIDDVRLHNRSFDATSVPPMVYAWSQIKPITRNDSLLAYYPFNGDAVNDNGRGFDGTLFNVTPAADRFGQAGRAFAFDGTGSYVELPQNMGPIATDFCLAFWMQSSVGTPMTACSLTRGITPGAADLNFVLNAGHALSVKLDGGTSTAISFGAPGDLTDGAWHFLLLQRVSGVFQLYVDAQLVGTMRNSSALVTSDSIIRFGRASGSVLTAANFWSGNLDDAQIYVTSFSQEDIENLLQLQVRPRDGAGLVAFRDKMWLLGGWNPADVPTTNSQVWSSSDGLNWSFICRAPWEGRHLAGWLVYDDRLWVVGGDNDSGHYQNQVWSSADGLNWVEETTSLPWANRATQYTVVFNGLMWLMGGQQLGSQSVPGAAYNDVYSSSDGKTWTLATAHAGWSPRGQIIGNVVYGGKMWVIGGGTYDVRTYLNDVWNSGDGKTWTQVAATSPWAGRQFHNVAVFDNKIWVVAGGTAASEGGTTDVFYSTDGVSWTRLPKTPWLQRHAASLLPFQNALWLACGSDAVAYNDVWKLTYAT